MNTLSSHVLDTTNGKPVAGMPLTLQLPDGSERKGVTDSDGRFKDWETTFSEGIYTLRFDCQRYLVDTHGKSFYPHIDITFELEAQGGHYHVPLLISPFGFSSYRGS
jgi:5-hydroxyisourate hydrolase